LPTPAPSRQRGETDPDFDRRMVLRAIALARRGRGRVEPNPMVGCVIVKSGKVIGEGWHRRFGDAHAEVSALRTCRQSPRGATAYVSLEPCCHQGKTPPCTDALIEAGIARVVFGARDPHRPRGRAGGDVLQRAGLRVDAEVERDAAREMVAPYLTRIDLKRPYVIAKWAQSLDGKLATRTGDSQWITGEPARRLVHKLRARVDTVLVGSQTVLADDPLLTARDVPVLRTAARVVVDARLRIPLKCKLVRTAGEVPLWVCTSRENAASAKARRLDRQGVEIVPCRRAGRRLSLTALLSLLADRDITNLLVEGGPTLLSSFFEANLVDEAHVFTAPFLIGGTEAPGALGEHGARKLSESLRALSFTQRHCGDDTLHVLRFTRPPP